MPRRSYPIDDIKQEGEPNNQRPQNISHTQTFVTLSPGYPILPSLRSRPLSQSASSGTNPKES
jgi:hypothetical protein